MAALTLGVIVTLVIIGLSTILLIFLYCVCRSKNKLYDHTCVALLHPDEEKQISTYILNQDKTTTKKDTVVHVSGYHKESAPRDTKLGGQNAGKEKRNSKELANERRGSKKLAKNEERRASKRESRNNYAKDQNRNSRGSSLRNSIRNSFRRSKSRNNNSEMKNGGKTEVKRKQSSKKEPKPYEVKVELRQEEVLESSAVTLLRQSSAEFPEKCPLSTDKTTSRDYRRSTSQDTKPSKDTGNPHYLRPKSFEEKTLTAKERREKYSQQHSDSVFKHSTDNTDGKANLYMRPRSLDAQDGRPSNEDHYVRPRSSNREDWGENQRSSSSYYVTPRTLDKEEQEKRDSHYVRPRSFEGNEREKTRRSEQFSSYYTSPRPQKQDSYYVRPRSFEENKSERMRKEDGTYNRDGPRTSEKEEKAKLDLESYYTRQRSLGNERDDKRRISSSYVPPRSDSLGDTRERDSYYSHPRTLQKEHGRNEDHYVAPRSFERDSYYVYPRTVEKEHARNDHDSHYVVPRSFDKDDGRDSHYVHPRTLEKEEHERRERESHYVVPRSFEKEDGRDSYYVHPRTLEKEEHARRGKYSTSDTVRRGEKLYSSTQNVRSQPTNYKNKERRPRSADRVERQARDLNESQRSASYYMTPRTLEMEERENRDRYRRDESRDTRARERSGERERRERSRERRDERTGTRREDRGDGRRRSEERDGSRDTRARERSGERERRERSRERRDEQTGTRREDRGDGRRRSEERDGSRDTRARERSGERERRERSRERRDEQIETRREDRGDGRRRSEERYRTHDGKERETRERSKERREKEERDGRDRRFENDGRERSSERNERDRKEYEGLDRRNGERSTEKNESKRKFERDGRKRSSERNERDRKEWEGGVVRRNSRGRERTQRRNSQEKEDYRSWSPKRPLPEDRHPRPRKRSHSLEYLPSSMERKKRQMHVIQRTKSWASRPQTQRSESPPIPPRTIQLEFHPLSGHVIPLDAKTEGSVEPHSIKVAENVHLESSPVLDFERPTKNWHSVQTDSRRSSSTPPSSFMNDGRNDPSYQQRSSRQTSSTNQMTSSTNQMTSSTNHRKDEERLYNLQSEARRSYVPTNENRKNDSRRSATPNTLQTDSRRSSATNSAVNDYSLENNGDQTILSGSLVFEYANDKRAKTHPWSADFSSNTQATQDLYSKSKSRYQDILSKSQRVQEDSLSYRTQTDMFSKPQEMRTSTKPQATQTVVSSKPQGTQTDNLTKPNEEHADLNSMLKDRQLEVFSTSSYDSQSSTDDYRVYQNEVRKLNGRPRSTGSKITKKETSTNALDKRVKSERGIDLQSAMPEARTTRRTPTSSISSDEVDWHLYTVDGKKVIRPETTQVRNGLEWHTFTLSADQKKNTVTRDAVTQSMDESRNSVKLYHATTVDTDDDVFAQGPTIKRRDSRSKGSVRASLESHFNGSDVKKSHNLPYADLQRSSSQPLVFNFE